MKAPRRIDGSICGALLLPRPSSNWPARAVTALAATAIGNTNSNSNCNGRPACMPYWLRSYSDSCADAAQTDAQGQVVSRRRAVRPPAPSFRTRPANAQFRVLETTASSASQADDPSISDSEASANTVAAISLTRRELLALVDSYDGEEIEDVDEHLRFFRDPYMRGYVPADEPTLTIARHQEDHEFPTADEVTPAGEEELQIIRELSFAVNIRLSGKRQLVDLDRVYEIYQRLPEPRIPYLQGRLRHKLLKVLGQPDRKNSKSMLRYFAVIADVKNCGIPLTNTEWNCAMSYASRYVAISTEAETESALKLWREMELVAGIKATDVTFNILFDVASKAGNFTLAEMIYREMESRGHKPNRYHYVSLIHFFGLKQDSGGIRAAYAEMVRAGEMIDTVALNAVISGLLRCGEEVAAENTYERMKAAALKRDALPIRNYASNQAITQSLMMFAKLARRFKDLQPTLQRTTPISPSLNTYLILVNHYGVKLGDLRSVAKFIDEMRYFQIPLDSSIFLSLFKSFALHGGYPGSAWSVQRLNSIWQALLGAMDEGAEGVEIHSFLAHWVLSAFHKCSNREAVMDAYESMRERWLLGSQDEQYMMDLLYNFVNK